MIIITPGSFLSIIVFDFLLHIIQLPWVCMYSFSGQTLQLVNLRIHYGFTTFYCYHHAYVSNVSFLKNVDILMFSTLFLFLLSRNGTLFLITISALAV